MVLTVLKHGGGWDFSTSLFGQKISAFEGMTLRFFNLLSEAVYEHYVIIKPNADI